LIPLVQPKRKVDLMETLVPQSFVLSADQEAREKRRIRSIYGGKYKFISLILNDIRRRNISGIEVVHSTPYINEQMGGVQDFFHEVRGGSIKFEFNESMGCWRYDMLDSDHNRKFLASMWDRNFWEIEDADVKKDIEKRAKAITESMIVKKLSSGSGEPTEETVGSLSRDMKLEHVDPEKDIKKGLGRPVGKAHLPDSPIGQVKNDDGIVTMGTHVKQP
jgi:hypothetical protein